MKYLLLLALCSSIIILPGFQCSKDVDKPCYRGKLAIKGICMNYTIQYLGGDPIDTSLIEREWKDPHTGITYQNVFKLGSICDFPSDIKEGDEFYFQIPESKPDIDCIVCMAFYPTPSKALNISVSKTPCD